MRLLSLFLVLNFFLCHTSISSTLNNFVAVEKPQVPSCHVVSANDSRDILEERVDEESYNVSENVITNSCCLLSLLNSKDLESSFKYFLSSVEATSFLENNILIDRKTKYPLFEIGHSPPDLIIQKSSLLI